MGMPGGMGVGMMGMPVPYGAGGAAQPLNPAYGAGPPPPGSGPLPPPPGGGGGGGSGGPTGATSRLASNAGELLSGSDDDAEGVGDKVTRRKWKSTKKLATEAETSGPQTDADLSKRLRQLYQNMDDDLTIKLDRERMEFMRREDQTKHQHKLEMARMEQEIREIKMGAASRAAMGGGGGGSSGGGGGGGGVVSGQQTSGTVSNAGILEDDHIPLGSLSGGPQQGVVAGSGQHTMGGSANTHAYPGSGAG
jgi:hypothetical protein